MATAIRSSIKDTPHRASTRGVLEGRLKESQLDHFRRETKPGEALVVSASAAHAGLLGVPDGVDGPRPITAIYQRASTAI